jgi:hypothetical protein
VTQAELGRKPKRPEKEAVWKRAADIAALLGARTDLVNEAGERRGKTITFKSSLRITFGMPLGDGN